MSETNKRHNRKIWRACPVCKGRVVLAYRNQNWWVYCEDDASHIPQRFFPHPHEAIEAWNVKGNKMTKADCIRAMPDEELAQMFWKTAACELCKLKKQYCSDDCKSTWLDWLREEADE